MKADPSGQSKPQDSLLVLEVLGILYDFGVLDVQRILEVLWVFNSL